MRYRPWWAWFLGVCVASCVPTVWPAPLPPKPPPVVPPQPPKPPDTSGVPWQALLDIETKAKAGPVTEAEVDAALGAHVDPQPYTQPREPFHKVISYAVRSSDGKESLRVHAHFLNGILVLPLNLE